MPSVNVGDIISTKDVVVEEHFTKPKSRYTEAKLIKELEELGIGRPSTYATIMSNIRERGYVEVVDKKFVPTEIGFIVTDKLQEYFNNIINVKYTANMENELDEIAEGKLNNIKVLHDFYDVFDSTLASVGYDDSLLSTVAPTSPSFNSTAITGFVLLV